MINDLFKMPKITPNLRNQTAIYYVAIYTPIIIEMYVLLINNSKFSMNFQLHEQKLLHFIIITLV